MRKDKRDFWSLRGALKKYAKWKPFAWKKMRNTAETAAAGRTVRVLRESRSR